MIGDRNRRPTGPEYAVRKRERGYYAQSLLASGLQVACPAVSIKSIHMYGGTNDNNNNNNK